MALGNGERYYSPTLARFIQQDSFTGSLNNGQSLNRFSYVFNNPYRYRDPSGKIPTVVVGALLGGLFGGLIEATHQAVDVYNGDREGFDLSGIGKAAASGAVFGAIIGTGVGALALLGYGAAATVGVTTGGVVVGATSFAINYQDGRTGHGAIDLAASLLPFLLPFANKGVRGSFGQFAGGGYTGTGVGTFRQNMANFRANGGASHFKRLFTNATPEMLQESRSSLENEPKQLTVGGRSNQKPLGDGGVQERIESGRLLPERSSLTKSESPIELPEAKYRLSEKAQKYYDKGGKSNKLQALDENYENLIQRKTGGERKIIYREDGSELVEIDAVTDDAVIQAKRSLGAIESPKNFLNKSFRNQVKRTVQYATEQDKTPEFWFKYGVSPEVKAYIEGKGGVVKIGLGD